MSTLNTLHLLHSIANMSRNFSHFACTHKDAQKWDMMYEKIVEIIREVSKDAVRGDAKSPYIPENAGKYYDVYYEEEE